MKDEMMQKTEQKTTYQKPLLIKHRKLTDATSVVMSGSKPPVIFIAGKNDKIMHRRFEESSKER